ncbi:MAG: helicase-related protein [Acidimicrobiales bacterium]
MEAEAPELYRWQLDALVSWLRCGRRGVIEAVTGSGKTDVAIAAAADARRRARFVLILVPSRVLMEQWHTRLEAALPGERLGRLGDRGRDAPHDCDILIATRHLAAAHRPLPPGPGGGLLIVDECHGLGGRVLRRALPRSTTSGSGSPPPSSAPMTPSPICCCRSSSAGSATATGSRRRSRTGCAPGPGWRSWAWHSPRRSARSTWPPRPRRRCPLPPPPGAGHAPGTVRRALAAVGHLAERDGGADGRAAREYLDAFGKRRQIVAQSSGKYQLLGRFAGLISSAEGALLFTETVRAANHAINRLDPLVSIDLITGATARRQRRDILDDLRGRRLDAVAAPRVLDEGIDVPDANLGIVMSASRTRRQMIQRMGRVLRRKRPGVGARFVILFARDTIEDPAARLDRDGFLDEIERIASATGVFAEHDFASLEAFLRAPAPMELPTIERARPLETVEADLAAEDPALAVALHGAEELYARCAFLRHPGDRSRTTAVLGLLEERLPPPPPPDAFGDAVGLYLELDFEELPVIAKPKVEPKKLSTGQAPLEIAALDDGFRMRCTGCGEVSEPVRFRWQVLDQTVQCRCA